MGFPEAARKAVEQAERDGDAEMAARARWILRQWKQGLTPDTPLDVRRSLQAASETTDPEELLDLLYAGLPDPLLNRLREDDRPTHEFMRAMLDNSLLQISVVLLQSKREDALVEILDRCAAAPRHAIARAELMRNLGKPESEWRTLPTAAKDWNANNRQEAEVWLAAFAKDHASAMQLATQLQLPKLMVSIMIQEEQWDAVAEYALEQATNQRPPDSYSWAAIALAAARFIDRGDLHDRAMALITDAKSNTIGSKQAATAWMLEGDLDRAITLIDEMDTDDLVRLQQFRHRYRAALEALSINPETLETDLAKASPTSERFITQTTEGSAVLRSAPECVARSTDGVLCGRRSASRDGFQQISRMTLANGQLALGAVLQTPPVVSQGWHVDFVLPQLATNRTTGIDVLCTAVDRPSWNAGSIVWETLGQLLPEETLQRRARAVLSLAQGELPQGWGARGLPDQLAELLVETLEKKSAAGNADGLGAGHGIVWMYRQIGRADLANLFEAYSHSSGWDDETARELLNYGYHERAIETYKEMFMESVADPSSSLVGWYVALRQSGAADEAEELGQIIKIIPANAMQHYGMSEAFREWGLTTHAAEQAAAAWRLADPSSSEGYNISRSLGIRMREQPRDAEAWLTRSLFSAISQFDGGRTANNDTPRVAPSLQNLYLITTYAVGNKCRVAVRRKIKRK